MNFSMGSSLSGRSTGSDSQSDRMRKAIERNRAKQARRSPTPPPATNGFGRKLPGAAPSSLSLERSSTTPSSRPTSSFANRTTTSAVPSRTGVANHNDTKFASAFRSRKQPPASPSYTTSTTPKRTIKRIAKPGQGTFVKYLVYAGWMFCVVLLFRLLFADRGVYEYFQKKESLQGQIDYVQMIAQENLDLKNEIYEIQNNKSYQKKLVRDHLGFIAKDEYLILFPKGKADPTI